MKIITSFAKGSFWILFAILPIWRLCGQSISVTDSVTRAEYIANVKKIHEDLVKGDLARREVFVLRAQLQTCEVANDGLENSLRNSQAREVVLANSVVASKEETEKARQEARAARWEVWLWRIGTAGVVIWRISTVFR